MYIDKDVWKDTYQNLNCSYQWLDYVKLTRFKIFILHCLEILHKMNFYN